MKKFNVQKLLKEREQWLDDPFNKTMLLDSGIQKLSSLRQSKPEEIPAKAASGLDSMSVWFAQKGVYGVGAKQAGGWIEIRRSLLYRIWDTRIDIRRIELSPKPEKNIVWAPSKDVGLALLSALWLKLDDHSNLLGSTYSRWLLDENFYGKSQYIQNGFAGFVYCLYQTWNEGQMTVPPLSCPPLGVYEKIFNAWKDPEALEKAVIEMCDFHLERISEQGPRDIAEFTDTPYDLLPVEYFALCRVRHDQGLDTPKPAHPLLDTVFAEAPTAFEAFQDETMDGALDVVREIIPDL